LIRSCTYRLVSIAVTLASWLVVTGHAQDSGIRCRPQVIDGGCETARKASPDGSGAHLPSAVGRPIVTYKNGQLMVTASNASLDEVLRAISAQTGTIIDFPAGSAADRIAVREGPASVRYVLTSLLNGSGFNYVILESPDSPGKLTRVVLAKAGQTADVLPQPAIEQKDGEDQAKTAGDPLLWTPSSGSSFLTSPKVDPAAADAPRAVDNGGVVPPSEPIPADALEQMIKDRTRQLREQVQQPQ
jgi:hypothetical protein